MKKLNPFDKRSIFRDPVNTFTPLSKMGNENVPDSEIRYTCVIKNSNDVFKIIFSLNQLIKQYIKYYFM